MLNPPPGFFIPPSGLRCLWAVTLTPLRFPGYSLSLLDRLIWGAQHMRGQRVLIKILGLGCLLSLTWSNLQDRNGASQGTFSPVASSAAEEAPSGAVPVEDRPWQTGRSTPSSTTSHRQRLLRTTNTIFLLIASLHDTGALWWCGRVSQALRTVFAAADERVVLHDVRWEGRSLVLASSRPDAVAAFRSELRRGLLAFQAGAVQLAALHQSLSSP